MLISPDMAGIVVAGALYLVLGRRSAPAALPGAGRSGR
jgi:hypothetical protein